MIINTGTHKLLSRVALNWLQLLILILHNASHKFSQCMSVIKVLIIESDADVAALYVCSFAEPDLYTVRCDNTISRLAAVIILLCMLGNGRN